MHHDDSWWCIMMSHHDASWWVIMMHRDDYDIMMHHGEASWCIMMVEGKGKWKGGGKGKAGFRIDCAQFGLTYFSVSLRDNTASTCALYHFTGAVRQHLEIQCMYIFAADHDSMAQSSIGHWQRTTWSYFDQCRQLRRSSRPKDQLNLSRAIHWPYLIKDSEINW